MRPRCDHVRERIACPWLHSACAGGWSFVHPDGACEMRMLPLCLTVPPQSTTPSRRSDCLRCGVRVCPAAGSRSRRGLLCASLPRALCGTVSGLICRVPPLRAESSVLHTMDYGLDMLLHCYQWWAHSRLLTSWGDAGELERGAGVGTRTGDGRMCSAPGLTRIGIETSWRPHLTVHGCSASGVARTQSLTRIARYVRLDT